MPTSKFPYALLSRDSLTELESTTEELFRSLERNKSKLNLAKNETEKVYQDTLRYRSRNRSLGELKALFDSGSTISVASCPIPSTAQECEGQGKTAQVKGQAGTTGHPKKDPRKAKVSPRKLRGSFFKIFDRIFKLPKDPGSVPKQNERNEGARESAPDELTSRSEWYTCTEEPTIISKGGNVLDETTKEEHGLADFSRIMLYTMSSCEVVSVTSHSDEDSEISWMYVENPIQIQNVAMDDSLSQGQSRSSSSSKESKKSSPARAAKAIPEKPRRFLQRSSKNGKPSKISKLRNDREESKLAPRPVSYTETLEKNQQKIISKLVRPDSPVTGGSRRKWTKPATSLPNLMEASISSDDTLPNFNTNSFTREIKLRPSSTLLKSAPSLNNLRSHDFSLSPVPSDNDMPSTLRTSSLSTLQVNLDEIFSSKKKPSALCHDVYVTPINIPIRPLSGTQSVSSKEVKKTSGAFAPRKNVQIRNEHRHPRPHPSTPKACLLSGETSAEIDDEMTIVRQAFSWLDDQDDCEEESSSKENEPIKRLSSAVADVDIHIASHCDELSVLSRFSTVSRCIDESNRLDDSTLLTLNSSVPPPPPFPPPPPPPQQNGVEQKRKNNETSLRRRLPLEVFTKPRKEKSVFNRMAPIQIGEGCKQQLKEKFFQTNNKSINGEKTVKLAATKSALQFQLNVEVFMRKWSITEKNIDILTKSISTLNGKPGQIDMACVATLAIPKKEEIDKISEARRQRNLTQAEIFLWKINEIPGLSWKLESIKFSLDFEDIARETSRRLSSFVSACKVVTTSEMFIKIINVLMEFMNCLIAEHDSQIYGFDIQSLNRLAMKTSEDGTTTLLHFLIQYILEEPALAESANFYLDFADLGSVSKTSLAAIAQQMEQWKKCLKLYQSELTKISARCTASNKCSLEFATEFQFKAESNLLDLQEKLSGAQSAFAVCKELYPSNISDVSETNFFESLHQFISAYRSVHDEVVERNQRVTNARRKSTLSPHSTANSKSPGRKVVPSHRKSNGKPSPISESSIQPKPQSRIPVPANDLEHFLEQQRPTECRRKRLKKNSAK